MISLQQSFIQCSNDFLNDVFLFCFLIKKRNEKEKVVFAGRNMWGW